MKKQVARHTYKELIIICGDKIVKSEALKIEVRKLTQKLEIRLIHRFHKYEIVS